MLDNIPSSTHNVGMSDNIRYIQVRNATFIGGLANLLLAIIKIVFGTFGHSSALVADGIHSFSDLLTNFLVIFAAKYANQSADAEHPYGHARIETIASFLLAAFLIVVGGLIGWHGIGHIFQKEQNIVPDFYVVWLALFSVIVNEIIYRYTLAVGKRVKSDLLIANAIHSRSDAASSLIVLIGVIGSLAGYAYFDDIAAIIVAVLIIKMGYKIAWDNVKELMDTGLSTDEVYAIKKVIMEVPGVKAIHELRTRKMAGRGLLDVHIIVDPHITVSEGHHIAEQVMANLHKKIEILDDVTVHIDSENDEQYSSTAKLPMRPELLNQLEMAWQGLPGANQIKDIKLHYLAGKIQVDIVLPLSIITAENSAENIAQLYCAASSSLSIISKVIIFYQ